MDRREDKRGKRRRDELAAMRSTLQLKADKRMSRRSAQADDRPRLDELNLSIEPRPARRNLAGVRFLVNASLAARLPLEVLDDVGDVDRGAIDAGVLERAIEQLAGRSDERMSREVFGIARLLADEHELSFAPAFAEDGLRASLVQIASLTVSRRLADGGQRRSIRNPFGGVGSRAFRHRRRFRARCRCFVASLVASYGAPRFRAVNRPAPRLCSRQA